MFTTSDTLLSRLRRPPDEPAWTRFVDLYSPLFYAWAQRLGLARYDAADCVQDFFVLLWRKLPEFSYDPRGNFRAWLKTVFRHSARDWLERQQRQGKANGVDRRLLEQFFEANPAEAIEESEYRHYLVHRALALIKTDFQPETWHAFEQLMMQERSAAEVARTLGVSTNAVYLAKGRVMRRLREELAGLLPDF